MLTFCENDLYFLSMEMYTNGNCAIILRRKISENYGKKIFFHLCHENTKQKDFDIYYDLENKIKNYTLDDSYIKSIGGYNL